MATLSAIEYEERRNKDKSLFSRMLKVTVTLEAGESKVDLSQPIPKLVGLQVDHVISFVSDKLDQDACPEFTTADKIVLPPTAPAAIKEQVKPAAAPAAEEKVPDPNAICKGCKDDSRCENPCAEWHEAQQKRAPGPAVPAAPRTESKLTIVKCSVCGEDTERRVSQTTNKPYRHCRKCNENRTLEGKPFSPR